MDEFEAKRMRDLCEWVERHERERKDLVEARDYVYETSVVVLKKQPKVKTKRTPTFDKETKEIRFHQERGKCQWCHRPIAGSWHAHHIIPRSQGGGNNPENLMVLHPGCHLNPLVYEVLHPGMVLPKAFNICKWDLTA